MPPEVARKGDLLEPHVKRSHGGLRDVHMVRWLGMIGFGTPELAELVLRGALTAQECAALGQATDFLLRVRNELHFHAGRCQDVLSRWEQLRLAEVFQYQAGGGMLPVEHFMRHYLRHTKQVGRIANRLRQQIARPGRWTRWASQWFGRRIGDGFLIGRWGVTAIDRARERVQQGLSAVMELVDLASAHGERIAAETWELVQRQNQWPAEPPDPESCRRFLAVLGRPVRLGELLGQLHEAGLLACFIPAFRHALGLLQFNQYHKYTVDEHCLRAVEKATELAGGAEARGDYRPETKTVEFIVATKEAVARGIFHRLTGALSGQGLEILSAQINTLAEGEGLGDSVLRRNMCAR